MQKVFVTESAVSKWERGTSYPDISLVSLLCSELKISEQELLCASEDLYQRKIEKQSKRYQNVVHSYIGILSVLAVIPLVALLFVFWIKVI